MNEDNKLSALIKAAVEMTTAEAPDWEFIAARLASYQLNKDISTFEETEGIHSLYEKLRYLTDEKLYGDYILKAYSEEEIAEAASFIVP